MGRRKDNSREKLVELLDGRPGWRLEPRSTPGASPLWCYVADGEIELSVTAEDGVIRLYVMASDEELAFQSADALWDWLRAHREDASQEHPPRPGGRARMRQLFEWG
jgi:hypothetical protein